MYTVYRSKNKFNAKKSSYNGVEYDSIKEMRYAMELDLRKKAHDIKDWERQIKIPLIVNNKKICTYICDFKLVHNDGVEEFVEIKGFRTATFNIKAKLLKAIYPNIKYTIEE